MKSMSVGKEHAEQNGSVAYPEIPRCEDDRNVILDWGGKLLMLQRSNAEAMRSVLGHYVSHVWKTSNGFRFLIVMAAIAFGCAGDE